MSSILNTKTSQTYFLRVFDSEEEAIAAIWGGKIKDGDVVVIRYEGPKGGPGMREMLSPTSAIMGAGLGSTVALITGKISASFERSVFKISASSYGML